MHINQTFQLLLASLLVTIAGCSEYSLVMDAQYTDMEAVRTNTDFDQSPIVRGWIPEFLPEEAVHIHERHSLDTNEGWGAFSFDEIDLTEVEKHWGRTKDRPSPKDPNRFPREGHFDWSLDGVNRDHTFSDGTFTMVIDTEKKEGYFWQ